MAKASTWILMFGVVAAGALSWNQFHVHTRPAHAAPPRPVEKPRVRADGRVVARPGAQVTVSAETLATIAHIDAREGVRVKKGDVLVEFKRSEQTSALREAYASSAEASARLKARDADLTKARALVQSGSLPQQQVDNLNEEKAVARARLAGAQATAARLKTVLQRSQVTAPIDGVVMERNVEEGETVVPGAPLFTIVDLDKLRVEAEIDEFDLGRVAIGGVAEIRAESFPGQSWKGAVEEIPAGLAKRKLRPLDPSRPTDTAVLLAKITFPTGTPLKLGQRVNLELTEVGKPARTQ